MATEPVTMPPDNCDRQVILHELQTTLLVEAAAGTGKTTSMIGRMVRLLAAGECSIDTLAAVTFTRKAAAELRSRFQVGLEKAYRSADRTEHFRLAAALAGVERCFIGTIHSFCGRMLRERPVEAGVDVEFEEMDEAEDMALRNAAWNEYVRSLYDTDDSILEVLEELGVEIGQLGSTFMKLAEYPDVELWPVQEVPEPDTSAAMAALSRLTAHMEDVAPTFPEDPGNDRLMPQYRVIPLIHRQVLRQRKTFEIMDLLTRFKTPVVVKRNWPGEAAQADDEVALWDEFRTVHAEPLVRAWREHRYGPLLRAVQPAVERYDRLRKSAGRLNYQDLLMTAAALLRDRGPAVRGYFAKRFTHLLVDEFQDTDPIQAEVIMLLTAENVEETDWRLCRPKPGSLFVVGDPKQSIYRFRRADIVTYNQVKEIIVANGGRVVRLSANFRTTKPLVDWVNQAFQSEFDKFPAECSPEYVALEAVRDDDGASALSGVGVLRIPKDLKNGDRLGAYDAGLIAGTIRSAIEEKLSVPRTQGEKEAGIGPEATPGDFLIVTPKTAKLGTYSRKLQELGIPHQVTGGSALNRIKELFLLHSCLKALTEPDNPVALLAVLRGELFGFSDPDLFAFKRAGGRFSYLSPIPDAGLDAEVASLFDEAFRRLYAYSRYFRTMPLVPAVERIIADLGLSVRAAAGRGGDVQAGSLAKALELLRNTQTGFSTAADLVTCLERLVTQEENHDSIPAVPPPSSVVRLMNLHKVKGLEAPVVFLADPTGKSSFPVSLFIDRSGPKVKGYMTLEEKSPGSNSPTVLAQPVGWEALARREQEFQEAEDLRLLYVAATRAGCGLTVTQRANYQNRNPWAFFDSRLKGKPVLKDPAPHQSSPPEEISVSEQERVDAMEAIRQRWDSAAQPTYDVQAIKAVSVKRGKFAYSQGEHGVEWGTIIHLLLEAAMLNPDADLHALAEAALQDQGLDVALLTEALEIVESVIHSQLWRRAQAADHRLVETPFQRYIPATEPAGVGVIMRGVIDLAFVETQGWVIVDYKSDRVADGRLGELTEHYTPQLAGYKEAWEAITGEKVSEMGLYFTHPGKYVVIPRPATTAETPE